jgi:nitroreductase
VVEHGQILAQVRKTPAMPTLNLSVDEVLRTTRAVRKRLDFERPVEESVLRECLELAIQAPTGSNAQSWQFVVVTDSDKKKALGEIYRRAWGVYETMDGINARTYYKGPNESRVAQHGRVMDSAAHLAERMGEVPAMLIPCITAKLDGGPNIMGASQYGSVLPAVWSFMLAARERGLGTAWTSLHLMFEEEAAGVLGIPFAEVSQLALITIGYSQGTDFKPAKREPLDTVLHWNSW